MRILALETALQTGSVAALDDDRLLGQQDLDPGRRTAQTLAPAMADILHSVGWRPPDVQLVAVAYGPGSFTGVRVGVTTAKTFAYGVRAEVAGVDTLEVIAAQSVLRTRDLWAVVDAQRGDLFAARFVAGQEGNWDVAVATHIVNHDKWLGGLACGDGVTGPALLGLGERLRTFAVEEASRWAPRAETVGRVALRRYREGQRHDVWALTPLYCRKSAAEEKLEQNRP